ncbi:hypothetical protein CI610_03429 [invertebrate metagenome]|uniref:Uncharacterized protein n=1 Tax=invertebrate metagenome TaxID=1711999 RepID=A0A2H9T334_9ZZZZ
MEGLQQTVRGIIGSPIGPGVSTRVAEQQFNLTTPGELHSPTGGYRLPISEFGVTSEDISHIDIISEKLKKKIWEGDDINLAHLLMPKYETRGTEDRDGSTINININEVEDPRLTKSLTISEFVTAFGKYKRTICKKAPHRRIKLDRYEANIIEIANIASLLIRKFDSERSEDQICKGIFINMTENEHQGLNKTLTIAESIPNSTLMRQTSLTARVISECARFLKWRKTGVPREKSPAYSQYLKTAPIAMIVY